MLFFARRGDGRKESPAVSPDSLGCTLREAAAWAPSLLCVLPEHWSCLGWGHPALTSRLAGPGCPLLVLVPRYLRWAHWVSQALYEVAQVATVKHHRLHGSKDRNCFLPVLEVKSLRTTHWEGQVLRKPLSLACRQSLFPVFSWDLSSGCFCVLISSYKETSHVALGSILKPSL